MHTGLRVLLMFPTEEDCNLKVQPHHSRGEQAVRADEGDRILISATSTGVYTPLQEGQILSVIVNESLLNDIRCSSILELSLVVIMIWSKEAVCVDVDTRTYWLLWVHN